MNANISNIITAIPKNPPLKVLSESQNKTKKKRGRKKNWELGDISVDVLNDKEKLVLIILSGNDAMLDLKTLSAKCFPDIPRTKSNSWVRNSLRRLVLGGLVERINRGAFKLTENGRARL